MKHELSALSPQQEDLLHRYEDLLRDPGIARGMVARADADRLRSRHIDDGLRGAPAIPDGARSVCDLGSGGGVPGVVLAVARPGTSFTLTDQRGNRAGFLELVVQTLGLENCRVHHGDVRTLPAASFQVCTARAFADPLTTWRAAERLLEPGGSLVYWAGASFEPADLADEGVELAVHAQPEVAGSGPLVIMTRQ